MNTGRAEQFAWGSIQWLCSGVLHDDAQQTSGYVRILPGRQNPLHHHPSSDEVLYLLDGELQHNLDGIGFYPTPGKSIHIPQGVSHDARNPANRVALMLVS